VLPRGQLRGLCIALADGFDHGLVLGSCGLCAPCNPVGSAAHQRQIVASAASGSTPSSLPTSSSTPASRAECAAHMAALPAPTMSTSTCSGKLSSDIIQSVKNIVQNCIQNEIRVNYAAWRTLFLEICGAEVVTEGLLLVISKITQLNLFRHAGEGRYPF
jgi:hypothetical protein